MRIGFCGTSDTVSSNDPFFHYSSLRDVYVRHGEHIVFKCRAKLWKTSYLQYITRLNDVNNSICCITFSNFRLHYRCRVKLSGELSNPLQFHHLISWQVQIINSTVKKPSAYFCLKNWLYCRLECFIFLQTLNCIYSVHITSNLMDCNSKCWSTSQQRIITWKLLQAGIKIPII